MVKRRNIVCPETPRHEFHDVTKGRQLFILGKRIGPVYARDVLDTCTIKGPK